ncbi:hypothetical protein EXW94_00755 [Enterobacter sp. JMULE2]|nr:hypothetical protein [Enterobacter sp. JMULE2]
MSPLHRYGDHPGCDEARVKPAAPGLASLTRFLPDGSACADYSQVSKRAKRANISIKRSARGEISTLVIDATVLKVFGEEEWRAGLHGAGWLAGWRRVWRKRHLVEEGASDEMRLTPKSQFVFCALAKIITVSRHFISSSLLIFYAVSEVRFISLQKAFYAESLPDAAHPL